MFDWLRGGSRSVHLRGRGGLLSWDDIKLNPNTFCYLKLSVPFTEGSYNYFFCTYGLGRSLGGFLSKKGHKLIWFPVLSVTEG